MLYPLLLEAISELVVSELSLLARRPAFKTQPSILVEQHLAPVLLRLCHRSSWDDRTS